MPNPTFRTVTPQHAQDEDVVVLVKAVVGVVVPHAKGRRLVGGSGSGSVAGSAHGEGAQPNAQRLPNADREGRQRVHACAALIRKYIDRCMPCLARGILLKYNLKQSWIPNRAYGNSVQGQQSSST